MRDTPLDLVRISDHCLSCYQTIYCSLPHNQQATFPHTKKQPLQDMIIQLNVNSKNTKDIHTKRDMAPRKCLLCWEVLSAKAL